MGCGILFVSLRTVVFVSISHGTKFWIDLILVTIFEFYFLDLKAIYCTDRQTFPVSNHPKRCWLVEWPAKIPARGISFLGHVRLLNEALYHDYDLAHSLVFVHGFGFV